MFILLEETLQTVSENAMPDDSEMNVNEEILSELSSIRESIESMGKSQDDFIELIKEELFAEPTEEELLLQTEKESADLAYRVNLLNTLNNINAGMVSQNALLEENNRLLERSISMNSVSVSDNTVSQNAIITTKLEDYSLTDSLLLILIVLIFCFGIINLFFRKGD